VGAPDELAAAGLSDVTRQWVSVSLWGSSPAAIHLSVAPYQCISTDTTPYGIRTVGRTHEVLPLATMYSVGTRTSRYKIVATPRAYRVPSAKRIYGVLATKGHDDVSLSSPSNLIRHRGTNEAGLHPTATWPLTGTLPGVIRLRPAQGEYQRNGSGKHVHMPAYCLSPMISLR